MAIERPEASFATSMAPAPPATATLPTPAPPVAESSAAPAASTQPTAFLPTAAPAASALPLPKLSLAPATALKDLVQRDLMPDGMFTPRTTERASVGVGKVLTFLLGLRSIRADSFGQLVTTQLPLQYLFLISAPMGPHAAALAAGLLGLVGGLVGLVGHLIVLEPPPLLLSACLTALSALVTVLEADGEVLAEVAASILTRLPTLAAADGRAALCAGAGLIGILAGPVVLSWLSVPLVLVGVLNFTAHLAAAPAIARLAGEVPDAAAARQRFQVVDVERTGSLRYGALSRLSPGIPPGSLLILRGVSLALCPRGGHEVTADSLAAWREAYSRDGVRSAQGASGGEDTRAHNATSVPAGPTRVSLGEDLTVELAPDVQCLLRGPMPGGWQTHRASGSLALSAVLLCISAGLSCLAGLPAIWTNRAPSLLVTLTLPAGVALGLALRCLAIEIILVGGGPGAWATPRARAALATVPPLTLCTCRAALLLIAGAMLWQALPEDKALLAAPLAFFLGLTLLWSVFFAGAGVWLAASGERVLLESFEPADLEDWVVKGAGQDAWPGEPEAYGEAFVALDMRRRGAVDSDDVARFHGAAA